MSGSVIDSEGESILDDAASSRNSKQTILVGGATGYLGKFICIAAAKRGLHVRTLVRSAGRLGDASDSCAEEFVGQATEIETLAGMCDGIDYVVTALGNRTFKRKPSPFLVDRDANLNILKVAEAAAVKRFLFVSAFNGKKTRKRVPQIEAREQAVEVVVQSELDWTIIRPNGFFNDMTEFLDMAKKGKVRVVGNPENRFNPIHGADLAEFIIDKLLDPAAAGCQFPVGGPESLSQREVGELCFEALGKSGKIKSMPGWMLRSIAAVIKPFNVNLGSFLALIAGIADGDNIAPATGTHRLADFFVDQVSGSDSTEDLRANR
jgi:uncharacterized protein YbjT (DUF2867 family)